MKLAGEVAIIAGGAGGLGYATAENVLELGGKVCIFDMNLARAEEACEKLQAATGGTAVAAGGSITDRDDVQAAIDLATAELGPIDFLINAAGVASRVPVAAVSEEEWDRTIDIDLTGVFITSQLVGKGMAERGKGRIVNIASLAGKRGGGFLGQGAYSTAKAAVMGLSKALARELAPSGVTVNSIAPGAIDTEMTKVLTEEPERLAMVEASIPMGRRGVPREVADAITFLLTVDAGYITGETLTIDGGVLME
jgi:NAD(P)-dependent dehydrogenase (short-subunit alcohol dehydrogenase family)